MTRQHEGCIEAQTRSDDRHRRKKHDMPQRRDQLRLCRLLVKTLNASENDSGNCHLTGGFELTGSDC